MRAVMSPQRRQTPKNGAARAKRGPVLDLERYVPGLLTFVANKLSRSANAAYQRDFGVSVTEWRVLSQLAIEPAIAASRICQVIGFDKGPISRTLAEMENDGLIETEADPADARRRLISLTGAGRELHDRIIQVALAREERLLACLAGPERELLIGLLNRLHANLPAVTSMPPSQTSDAAGRRSPAARVRRSIPASSDPPS